MLGIRNDTPSFKNYCQLNTSFLGQNSSDLHLVPVHVSSTAEVSAVSQVSLKNILLFVFTKQVFLLYPLPALD